MHSRKSISNYVKNQKSNHVYVWHLLTNLILLQTPQNMIVYICFSFVFFTWHKLCNGKVLCHLAMPRSSHLVILLYITGNLANQRQVGIFTKYRSLQVLKWRSVLLQIQKTPAGSLQTLNDMLVKPHYIDVTNCFQTADMTNSFFQNKSFSSCTFSISTCHLVKHDMLNAF